MTRDESALRFSFEPGRGLAGDPDRRQFRNALGRYPTGVAIATCLGPDGRALGITINSFASVSLDPPLILWSIETRSGAASAFANGPRFAISVLGEHQEGIARAFAWPEGDPFAKVAHEPGLCGIPLMTGALASFECRREAVHPGGDHLILVGQVECFAYRSGRPLAFHEGVFLGLCP